jgi:hypothetical protein
MEEASRVGVFWAELAMPHTPEWLQDGSTIYTLTDEGVNEIWAGFYSQPYDQTRMWETAELAKLAMNERPRLLAQRDELLAALRDLLRIVETSYSPYTANEIVQARMAIRKAEEADREA